MSCHLKRDRLNRFFQNLHRQLAEAKRKGTLPDHSETIFSHFDEALANRAIEAKLRLRYG